MDLLTTTAATNTLLWNSTSTWIGVGFGTAALGNRCHQVVTMALEAGFRKFDTAEEHDWWYDQASVGAALRDFHFTKEEEECVLEEDSSSGECATGKASTAANFCRDLRISTKIPPWELISTERIRSNAAQSRQQLVGFCDTDDDDNKFPLDIYYIHAPQCWDGWHFRCKNPPPTLDLRSTWLALEAVVGLDHSASRIGLSNVRPDELLDIIQFVQRRQLQQEEASTTDDNTLIAPPRMPDAVQSFADPIRPADEIRKICRDHGIEFVSYSTLGTQHRSTNANPVLGSAVVQALAQKHERSTAEVVLSWALQHGMSVIPRSSQRNHIQQLARLLPSQQQEAAAPTVGFLDTDDLQQMESLKNSI